MKILSIGSDRNLFIKDSEAQKRIMEYGKLFDELHIVVFSTRNYQLPITNYQIADNVFVYPTNSQSRWFYVWDAYKIGKKIIHNSKFIIHNSVITAQDPFESGLAGWLLKISYQIPLQLQVHTDIFSPYFRKESILNRLRVLIARFLLPRADGVRVVSERIKASLSTFDFRLSTKISVLPIFVDIKKIQSAKIKTDLHEKYSGYDFIILMASRLTREKNIRMAIEAMSEIIKRKNLNPKPSTPNPLLLIVGDGPELEKLKAQSSKLKANVAFESTVDSQALFSYYKSADLFLLTSNYEGYGRTAVEAMAAGLPVIMTDVGLAGETLIDDLDGRVVPVGDKDALATAILELMDNPVKREEFKQNSLKLLEKWPTKQEYLEKYKNLLMMLK